MAGTGKSAIARTVARRYYNRGRLAASFFFSRGGGDSSHTGLFIPSIAHQLAHCEALGVADHIRGAAKQHSHATSLALQDQWARLVLQPLSKLETGSSVGNFLLVIDALDECDDERSVGGLLQLFQKVSQLAHVRLRILVTSRPETPIRHGFRQMVASDHQDFVLHHIPFEASDQDVLVFLKHHLSIIAREQNLHGDWPGQQVFDTMVQHAQGLFIWAATACKFIRDGRKFAKTRLQKLMKSRNGTTGAGPEAHLDEIYTTVLCASIRSTYDEDEEEEAYADLRLILGAIVTLLTVLTIDTLGALIGRTRSNV